MTAVPPNCSPSAVWIDSVLVVLAMPGGYRRTNVRRPIPYRCPGRWWRPESAIGRQQRPLPGWKRLIQCVPDAHDQFGRHRWIDVLIRVIAACNPIGQEVGSARVSTGQDDGEHPHDGKQPGPDRKSTRLN